MCGRFSIFQKEEILEGRFGAKLSSDIKPNYNASPSQNLPVILNTSPKVISLAKWGFVPHWYTKSYHPVINARAETLAEKSFFKGAFNKHHCLILADGFYEWKKLAKDKIPYRISLKDEKPFAFAGIWEPKSNNSKEATFAIITVEPNSLIKKIHNRMPVILKKEHEKKWLDMNIKAVDKLKLLKPYPATKLKAFAISKLINRPSNNIPQVISPLIEAL